MLSVEPMHGMSLCETETLISARQKAGYLIESVLNEVLTPQQALNRWPQTEMALQSDEALSAAYQALWHFESDETQQAETPFFLDVQLALLQHMTTYLQQGKPFPPYIVQGYPKDLNVRIYDQAQSLLQRIQQSVQENYDWIVALFHRVFDKRS